ncbi:MAG TPA: hypothetical protein VEK06_03790 [Myxococcota bacterium]|nr:hypothetical protein [Myxococcota bacterium]
MRVVWLFYCLSLALTYSFATMAIPKYKRTTLPFPVAVAPEDKDALIEVLKLQVHEDSEDPNLYYFMPPMHVRQYANGAASMMLFTEKVKIFAEVKKLVRKRNEYNETELTYLRNDAEKKLESVVSMEDKIAEARAAGNDVAIPELEKILERRTKEYDKATGKLLDAEELVKKGNSLMPAAMLKDLNELALFELAQARLNLPYTGKEDPNEIFNQIKNHTEKLASSYGGYLSVNAYAGFTEKQLQTLKNYKAKYFPQVRVALLPVESLTFFPLTETIKAGQESAIFTDIKGAGDYLGSTIVLNASILGAMGFATHLSPNVLPIGIKATFVQKMLPFEAELKCDYTTGYTVTGRADARDGWVIYDNDLTNSISPEDVSDGGCNIKLIKGDINSAEFAAMQTLDKTLTELQITRTHLAKEAKDQYYRSVMSDIQQNRRQAKKSWFAKLVSVFTGFGWETVLVAGLSEATDFHWHTNIQYVQNTSVLKFNKKVAIDGHATVTRDMPTNLCVVYNEAIRAYDRCTAQEEAPAQNTTQVAEEILASPECANLVDPTECGKARRSAGLLPNRKPGGRADSEVPSEI